MGHSRDNIRLSGAGGHRHPKVRKVIIVGSRKIVVYDDIAENKLEGIDRRAILGENMDFDNPEGPQFDHRRGDILMPKVKFVEPIRVETEHFLDCIRNSQEPLTGLTRARTVVSILERARPLNGEVKHGNVAA
jgi:predicted dehydrogenase